MPTSEPAPTTRTTPARPILKWVGGKQRLQAQFAAFWPDIIPRYFEPFLGGAAVFFSLWNDGRLPADVFLSDTNAEVINVYRVVRDDVEPLLALLAEHEDRHDDAYYYAVRAWDRQERALTPVERAARTIYLNRTGYNGLYRVNRQGHFNVPIGSYKQPRVLFEDRLRVAHRALQTVTLTVASFEHVLDVARADDFLYFDPPYVPLSETANFTSYTAASFDLAAQQRLAELYRALSDRGCRCMLSNSYTPEILALYDGFRIEKVQATRAINSNGQRRGAIPEVVVLNY